MVMKLAVSNIAWAAEQDAAAYEWMKQFGYMGLEIAPTRIFPESPYQDLMKAEEWGRSIMRDYGFYIASMQSIWFGRREKLFGSDCERQSLAEYTKEAVDFAAAIGCRNLVFGCPGNRNLPKGADESIGVEFFREVGEYAASKGAVIGMEANPPIYNTNYINDTESALRLIEEVDSDGFLLNLDVGTMIQNGEIVSDLRGRVKYIHHVHVSEPGLSVIQKRELHMELADLLRSEGYQGFISIEMGKQDKMDDLYRTLEYVKNVFL